jgi:hypothetical protein
MPPTEPLIDGTIFTATAGMLKPLYESLPRVPYRAVAASASLMFCFSWNGLKRPLLPIHGAAFLKIHPFAVHGTVLLTITPGMFVFANFQSSITLFKSLYHLLIFKNLPYFAERNEEKALLNK